MFNLFKKKAKKNSLYAIANGTLISIDQVKDPVFSQKMMGDGFAIIPTDGQVTSPIEGTVTSVFPTKHAIGLKTEDGLECLVHMGIDTVELDGEHFQVHVTEGSQVKQGTKLATIDLDGLNKANKENDLIVVFPPNSDHSFEIQLSKSNQVEQNEVIGQLK